jgi:hypothetical protein
MDDTGRGEIDDPRPVMAVAVPLAAAGAYLLYRTLRAAPHPPINVYEQGQTHPILSAPGLITHFLTLRPVAMRGVRRVGGQVFTSAGAPPSWHDVDESEGRRD